MITLITLIFRPEISTHRSLHPVLVFGADFMSSAQHFFTHTHTSHTRRYDIFYQCAILVSDQREPNRVDDDDAHSMCVCLSKSSIYRRKQ